MAINLNNIFVDANGRVSFSGLSTGVDFQTAVGAIIAAKRIPVDTLETRITDNTTKITAYQELRSLMNGLRDSLGKLYGKVSVGSSENIFQAKSVFASTSRIDSTTPSAAGSLIGVSVTNAANLGQHELEVIQTAVQHKIGSKTVSSTTTALGLVDNETFTVNGQTITVSSSDSLADLRDKINNANTGDNATGVTANIVSVTATDNVLVLTADTAGRANTITLANTGGNPLSDLGISADGGATLLNELQAAKDAQFYADGLRDKTVTKYQSALVSSSSADIVNTAGTLTFQDASEVAIASIAYSATDSITTIASNINADATLAAQGIRAAVVQDGTSYRLEITSTTQMSLVEGGAGDLLSTTNGISLDIKHESQLFDTTTDTFATTGGTLAFKALDGSTISSIAYTTSTTIAGLAASINGDGTLAAAGISASVVQDGAGYRLKISGDQDNGTANYRSFTIEESASGTGITDLGLYNKQQLIVRDTNTINDLFSGVTLSLFNAEKGTTIKLDVDRDLSQPKAAIQDMVDAYNSIRAFLNFHGDIDPTTGKPNEGATLFGSSTLASVESRLGEILGSGADGVSADFSVLAQIGINFVDNDTVTDPLMNDTLTIDSSKLDAKLISNPDDVRKLFTFDFSSSDPRVVLLGFDGNTTYKSGGFTMDITYDGVGSKVNSAILSDGATTITGNTIKASSGTAKGLQMLYTGTSDVTGITLNYSVGIGAKLFFEIDALLDTGAGPIETEIDNLDAQNILAQERVDEMLVRLEIQRETLLQKFIAMETALATMNNVIDGIKQTTNALFSNN